MIPYKLRLQNFLSYRDTLEPLDFTGMHLVCLIGANGHGKSALLDAITWALWGKARATSDDDLMHTGSDQMQVEFEFGLAGQRYNVVRKRMISGRSRKSELELAVWAEQLGAWMPLTEPSIRLSQARIIDILNMEYETFVNSAFLKQGEADAFTSKLPGQRKDILAAILNLSQYDIYAERAKQRAKDAQAGIHAAELRLREIDDELAQRPQYEQDLQTARLEESRARLSWDSADQELAQARADVQALRGVEEARLDLSRRLQDAQRNHQELEQQKRGAQTRLQAVEALLAERQAIEDGYAALQAARAEDLGWNKRLQDRRPLEQEAQRLQRAILEQRVLLDRDLALVQVDLAEAQRRAQAAPELEGRRGQITAQLARLETVQQASQHKRDALAGLAAEKARLAQDRKQVEQEGFTLKDRLQMLRSGEAAECPVCKQPLGDDGRQHLEGEYEQQLQNLREQLRRGQERLSQVDAEEKRLQGELASDERELRALAALQRQLAELEAALQQASAAAAALPALQEQRQALAARLQAEDYAPDLQTQLAALAAQIEALAYDEQAHQQAQATISDLSGIERKYLALEQALAQEGELRSEVERLQERWQRDAAQLAQDQTRLQQLQAELAALPQVQQRLQASQRASEQAQAAWEKAHTQVVAAQQHLAACEALVNRRAELIKEVAAHKERAARFWQLHEAFGPRGVQAMIIEAALPELEAEANLLLARLSDGRMSVRLETQRELKSGGLRETLDIVISDELGQRPYELYSGGEAFRADLALRIALSRLLARRAGSALQTLFIDEGFGTQDAHGRENLVEAIHMIKDEFALVLVITHIDELKEHFPVHIQVIKEDGAGSSYMVT